jgi:hypothetical protein
LLLGLSEKNVADRLIDINTVKQLVETGVKVYQQGNLHAKIYFNNDMVVVCSCNLSGASQREWLEAGIASNDFEILESVKMFFDEYMTDETLVTLEKIQALELQLTKAQAIEENNTKALKIEERVWVIPTIPAQREDPKIEYELTKKDNEAKIKINNIREDIYSIRLKDKKLFNIKQGDLVIRFEETGSELVLYALYKCVQASFITDQLYYISLSQQKNLGNKKWSEVAHLFEGIDLSLSYGEITINKEIIVQKLLILFSF